MRRTFVVVVLALGYGLGLRLGDTPAAAAAGGATTVWFAPRSQPPLDPAPDFLTLFQPGSPWQEAASHVRIFKIYPELVNGASDADLRAVIVGLQQRHIALAIEYGLLDHHDPALCGGKGPQCGFMVEGFGGEYLAAGLERLKSLGGDLRYVAMDEPVWFGHVSSEPGAPQAPIAAIAQDVAMQVATVRHYFPHAQVGDIEPVVGDGSPPGWVASILQWAGAYRAAVGEPLAFFHSDVGWQGTGWSPQLAELREQFHAAGIPFGIVYDGDISDDAVQWTTAAEQRFSQVEGDPLTVPDHAVLQSWNPQPVYALPETQPGTMTYVVDRYAAAETSIEAARTSSGFSGTLTSHGVPAAGAPIAVYEVDNGTLNITTVASLANTVPPGAALAVVALRVNTECGCSGAANVQLGVVRYTDQTSRTTVRTEIVDPSERVIVPAGQSLSLNSQPFAVTPGDAFAFSVPMEVPFSSSNTGYVAIAFLDANYAEIVRMQLELEPGQRLLGMAETDSRGRFALALPSGTSSPAVALFRFAGDAQLRLTSTVLQGGLP